MVEMGPLRAPELRAQRCCYEPRSQPFIYRFAGMQKGVLSVMQQDCKAVLPGGNKQCHGDVHPPSSPSIQNANCAKDMEPVQKNLQDRRSPANILEGFCLGDHFRSSEVRLNHHRRYTVSLYHHAKLT